MIKCDKGRIKMEGTPALLTAELGVITREVYRGMIRAGLSENFAKSKIEHMQEIALMTDEEFEKEKEKTLDEKAEKLADILDKKTNGYADGISKARILISRGRRREAN